MKKMGVDDDRIKAISAKLEYYVNPFDIVSMLNRENTIYNLEKPGEKPTRKELGTAHIVVPLHILALTLCLIVLMILVFFRQTARVDF